MTVGEGFLFAYSPPILEKVETIENATLQSVDGVHHLRFTKTKLLDSKVDSLIFRIFKFIHFDLGL